MSLFPILELIPMICEFCVVARQQNIWFFTENYPKKSRELWSPARQQIWPWSRSKVMVKVTTWYHRRGLVTKNTHAKYQSSICNSAQVMAKVKVFVTDRRTDRRMRFNVPTLSRKRGTITKMACCNHCYNFLSVKALHNNISIISIIDGWKGLM